VATSPEPKRLEGTDLRRHAAPGPTLRSLDSGRCNATAPSCADATTASNSARERPDLAAVPPRPRLDGLLLAQD